MQPNTGSTNWFKPAVFQSLAFTLGIGGGSVGVLVAGPGDIDGGRAAPLALILALLAGLGVPLCLASVADSIQRHHPFQHSNQQLTLSGNHRVAVTVITVLGATVFVLLNPKRLCATIVYWPAWAFALHHFIAALATTWKLLGDALKRRSWPPFEVLSLDHGLAMLRPLIGDPVLAVVGAHDVDLGPAFMDIDATPEVYRESGAARIRAYESGEERRARWVLAQLVVLRLLSALCWISVAVSPTIGEALMR